MYIEHKSIQDLRNGWYRDYKTGIILLAQLIHQKVVVNKQQLLGKIYQLEKGFNVYCELTDSWSAHKNTFRLSLNGEWYNDEHLIEIWMSLINPDKPVPIEYVDLVLYLLVRNNRRSMGYELFKKYRYAVMYDMRRYIDDKHEYLQWCYANDEKPINFDDNHGYCCDDCDGDYERYVWMYQEKDIKEHMDEFFDKIQKVNIVPIYKQALANWINFCKEGEI